MPNLFLKEEWKKLQQKGPILLNRKWWGTRFKLAKKQQIFTPNFSSITQKNVWLSFLWIFVFTAWGIWPILVFRSPIVLAYYKVSLNDHELLSSTSNYTKYFSCCAFKERQIIYIIEIHVRCWTECVVVKLQSNFSNFVLLWHKMFVSFGSRWNITATKTKIYGFSYLLQDNDPC